MDPISSIIIAAIVSWAIVNAGLDAGIDQAKTEARTAASAIRDDLRGRRRAWASDLNDRLAGGRSGGPATAMWWAWAAARTGRALRRAMRHERREAERKARPIRGTTGPFQRIFDAAARGARFARDEARRQREAGTRHSREPVGVCGRCGAVAAVKGLVLALTSLGRQERMCARCRAQVEVERATAESATTEPAPAAPGTVDADVVNDTPRPINRPRPRLGPAPADPTPVPVATPAPAPATSAPTQTAAIEQPRGETVANPPIGSLVPHRPGTSVARRPSGGNGGEFHTHGGFNSAATDIRRRMDELPAVLEQMLTRLGHADAGRSQVAGVIKWREDVVNYIAALEDMLATVNRIAGPVVRAVDDAGGVEEIASIGYMSEV